MAKHKKEKIAREIALHPDIRPSEIVQRLTGVSKESAQVYMSNLKRDDSFMCRVREIAERNGLTIDRVSKRHSVLIDSPDEPTALRAVDLAYKLQGAIAPPSEQTQNIQAVKIEIVTVDPKSTPIVNVQSTPNEVESTNT